MTLTKRQTQIVELVAQGLTAEEIADKLSRAIPTVRRHLHLAYERVGARNSAHLVAIAIKQGFIQLTAVLLITSMIFPHDDVLRNGARRPVRREETAIAI